MWTAARLTVHVARKLGTPASIRQIAPLVDGLATRNRNRNRFNSLQACYLATETNSSSTTSKNLSDNNPQSRQRRKTNSEILIENTNRLLEDSSSSWTKDDWKAGETALHAWTRQPNITRESVHRPFQLLGRMVQESEKEPNFVLITEHLNIVLDRWRIGTRYRNVVDRTQYSASNVLSMVDNFTSRIPSLEVNTKTYSMIMAVHVKQNPSHSPKLCTELLNRMQGSKTAPPNAVVLTHLMDAHVKSGQRTAAFATQSIFDYMVDYAKDPQLAPTEKSLTRVLQAWVLSGSTVEEAVVYMERTLDYMLKASQVDTRALPNSVFLNLVLDICAEKGRQSASAVPLADALMTLVREKSQEYPQLAPDASAFSSMVLLWAKSGLPEAPVRAEYWLKELHRASVEDPKRIPAPRGSLYTSVITAWEKSGLPEGAIRGEALWKHLFDNPSNITVSGYYLLLSLWSKSNLPEAPVKSEEVLREMLSRSAMDPRLYPSCPAFVSVISCWGKSDLPDAPYRAEAILDLLLDEHQHRSAGKLELSEVPFNTAIDAWAQSGLPQAELRAEAIINRMEKEAMTPSIDTAWSAIQCLSSDSADATTKAARFLKWMDNETGNTNYSLRGQLYKEVLRLWSESPHPDAPQKTEQVLAQYLSEPKKSRRLGMTMRCYDHVLQSWKKSDSPRAKEKMETFLNEMMEEAERVYGLSSNPSSYASVAQAWARSGLPNTPERVEEILATMLSICKEQGNCLPEACWFGGVIDAYAASGNVEQAQALLQRMSSVYARDWDTLLPTSDMYVAVIGALVDAKASPEIDRAREILEEMVDLYLEGTTSVKPTSQCFGSVMNAYATEGKFSAVEDLWRRLQQLQVSDNQDSDFQSDANVLIALCRIEAGHVGREDSILYHILERARLTKENVPDYTVLHCVLDYLVKSGDSTAGKRAEIILLKMQELYEEGCMVQPTFDTFRKVIDCWVEADGDGVAERADEILQLAETLAEAGDNRLEPDYEGYMSVIKAWSKSHVPDAPEHIQRHLRKFQKRFEGGEMDFELDERGYTALIEAYANCGREDAAIMAQTVFDKTPDEYKGTDLYNALITAQGGDSTRAEAILQEMHKAYLDGNNQTKPSTESFNNVILAWSRSGSPMAAWRADGVFHRMTDLTRNGQLDVKPNGRTFDLVISTLANEWGADAARKVDRYLDVLKDYYRSGEQDCMPSVTSYTEAIRAWGSNVDDPRAVLRAKALLDEMRELASEGAEGVKPDRSTYLVYLEALSQSSLESKAELAKEVLLLMKRDHIEPDNVLLSLVQRCSDGVLGAAWTVLLDDADEFPNAISPSSNEGLAAFP